MYIDVEKGFDRIINLEIEGSPYNPDWPMFCPICGGEVTGIVGNTFPTLEIIFACRSKYWWADKQLMTTHNQLLAAKPQVS